MWKYSQEGFLCLTYVEPNVKAMNITKLLQMILGLDILRVSAISCMV